MSVVVKDGFIDILSLQFPGKKNAYARITKWNSIKRQCLCFIVTTGVNSQF